MSELTVSPSKLDLARARLHGFARRHSRPLVLGCMLAGALLVWLVPVAPETRCMLVKQRALGMQGAASLSIALTALGWWLHKPAMRFLKRRNRDESTRPSE